MADPTTDDVTALANAQRLALALCAPCGDCGHEVEDHAPEGCLIGGCRCDCDMTGVEVESVLASSWLAERDARVRAEALREAAGEHLSEFGAWDAQESHRPGGVADWLRARADRIEAQP